jgi:TorA maturation chaperone TorD
VSEPEDHIAFLCETLSGLVAGAFPAAEAAARDPQAAADAFFARHLRPWAGRFFADLEAAQAARFYRPVGALGRTAVEIEQAAAELAA